MGEHSNQFHREVARPKVSRLLEPKKGDFILDAACGNGNYSAYMAQAGARVVAFDYSPKMIALAKQRQQRFLDQIEFCVADATKKEQLLSLRRGRPYTKAVSNMAIMDIADVTALFSSIAELLESGGCFVFATQHPCFVTLTEKYRTAHPYYGIAIQGQPARQCYYHRSLRDLFQLCFDNGFVVDGFFEESYGDKERPDIIIVRARKR